ncbi:MAG: radical SAM protein [Candidatus Thorarchaeota archaeon]
MGPYDFSMIDPIKLSRIIEHYITSEISKKYYRFRKTQFYGGCATADCLGCNLRCVYCWAQKKVWKPEKFGEFYAPKQVIQRLLSMNLPLIRISGGEPTIFKRHLLELLKLVPKQITFILETNGLLIDEEFIKGLIDFKNIYVRVSLKGIDEETFELITGAKGQFFYNQLNALDLLKKYGINHRAAILYELFTDDQIKSLKIPDLEFEPLIRYPFVLRNLSKKGIKIIRD